MNERVQKVIDERLAVKRRAYEAERDALLLSLGLYDDGEREYIPYVPYEDRSGYSYDGERKQYYRASRVPIKISDEEYEALRSVVGGGVNTAEVVKSKVDGLGLLSALNVVWLIVSILGCISAIILACVEYDAWWYWAVAVGLLFSGLLTFSAIRVFASISSFVRDIRDGARA